jgi:hypothetical protein
MITNFEQETARLSTEELVMIDLIVAELKDRDESKAIKSDALCDAIGWGFGDKPFRGARLRKIVNAIRSSGMLPIIATSKGYYCSFDPIEIMKQIISLQERADAINNSAKGLRRFLAMESQLELFE